MNAQPQSHEVTKGTQATKRRSDEATKSWGHGGTRARSGGRPRREPDEGTTGAHSTIGNRPSALGNGRSQTGNRLAHFLVVVGMMTVAIPAFAQSGGGLELKWSSTHTGTTEPLVGGGFSLQGSVGQAGAGTITGGGLELTGGFWAATLAPPPEPCDECRLYGDVAPEFCLIDVDDLLMVLDGFVDPEAHPEADIAPCGGNAVIDVDDILAELGAFVGDYACPHPCPP